MDVPPTFLTLQIKADFVHWIELTAQSWRILTIGSKLKHLNPIPWWCELSHLRRLWGLNFVSHEGSAVIKEERVFFSCWIRRTGVWIETSGWCISSLFLLLLNTRAGVTHIRFHDAAGGKNDFSVCYTWLRQLSICVVLRSVRNQLPPGKRTDRGVACSLQQWRILQAVWVPQSWSHAEEQHLQVKKVNHSACVDCRGAQELLGLVWSTCLPRVQDVPVCWDYWVEPLLASELTGKIHLVSSYKKIQLTHLHFYLDCKMVQYLWLNHHVLFSSNSPSMITTQTQEPLRSVSQASMMLSSCSFRVVFQRETRLSGDTSVWLHSNHTARKGKAKRKESKRRNERTMYMNPICPRSSAWSRRIQAGPDRAKMCFEDLKTHLGLSLPPSDDHID